jgi:PAS domain S-box-containing protein
VGQARAGPVGGEPATFIVNSRDITERLAQERALRASKDRLRTVIAGAPLVLFALDKEGVFSLVEGKGLENLGVRPALLVGQSVFQVYADLPQLLADFHRALAGESFSSTVEVFGQVFEAWYAPVRDGNGAISGVTGVATDVTERRRVEEALRRSEESHRALVQHATYGICRSTPAGRFLAVNPALVKMLGYESEAELLDLDLARDLYADPAERARLLARYAGTDSLQEVTEWKRKDGTRILVRISGHAVRGSDGAIESLVAMAEDITERRMLEEQLRQSQKIDALGQLTGGIAHDFNNLLTIILANAELIRKGMRTEQSEEHADLRDLISAALRGRAMVKELLGFARRTSLTLVPLDLASVVVDVSGMLRRVLPADIEVLIAGAAEALPEIRADAHAIEQIIFNLVTNARDAMPDGGVLRIEMARAPVSEEQRAAAGAPSATEWVQLAIEDTGVGMDDATRRRIFEPFFTTKPSGKGTGLGMATVHGLVKQLGGVIVVDSAPGLGTRVKVSFPAIPEGTPAPRRRLSGDHHAPGGDETILLVEDEDQVRRAGKRVLEQAGYQVLTASDGQEALDVLRAQRDAIRLVVSDLVMPRLGGRGLYDAARREGCQTPFLFASGYSPDDGRGDLPAELGLPLLHKPWTSGDLLAHVREILDDE